MRGINYEGRGEGPLSRVPAAPLPSHAARGLSLSWYYSLGRGVDAGAALLDDDARHGVLEVGRQSLELLHRDLGHLIRPGAHLGPFVHLTNEDDARKR